MDAPGAYESKRDRLRAQVDAARAVGGAIELRKTTSNLFRQRNQEGTRKVDVRDFNHVISVDRQTLTADVEGMTSYEALVDATLAHGLLPEVTPQLKTITVGGAVSGLGIESSSFRFGLVHETVETMEVLTGEGGLTRCSRHENADLFYGFPNSYGSLGYALRVTLRLIPAQRYVHLTHTRFTDAADYFARIADLCAGNHADFIDGTVFGAKEMYVTSGAFSNDAPEASDYTYMRIYYRSIQNRQEDWLPSAGYIWRWDTDWFWCSKQFYAQNPLVRLLATPWGLNSRTYQRIMRLSHKLLRERGLTESVIADVDIPLERAQEFLDFLLTGIGITPVWVCPFRNRETFPLYALAPGKLFINFGFWDVVPSPGNGHFNRQVEQKALQLGGKKALYSTAFYDERTFWQIYNGDAYHRLKAKYDPHGVFPGLYEKCVGRR